jgi:hypothetical protein
VSFSTGLVKVPTKETGITGGVSDKETVRSSTKIPHMLMRSDEMEEEEKLFLLFFSLFFSFPSQR